MADLKASYDSIDDIPESIDDVRSLFTERNGKLELSLPGLKTQADVDRVQASLLKERNAHKETRSKFERFGDLDPDEVFAKLDRIPELEAAAAGKLDDAGIDEIVNKRLEGVLNTKLRPLERKLATTEKERDEFRGGFETLKGEKLQNKIHGALDAAATKSKCVVTALEDIRKYSDSFEVNEDGDVVTRDGVGVPPGMDAENWLIEMQPKREHWWPQSVGGGAPGSNPRAPGFVGGKNPFTDEHWSMKAQGDLLTSKGRDYADKVAAAAGTTVGGKRPKPRSSR